MNNMTLYDLSSEYLQALELFTDPEADIPLEAAIDTLEGIQGQLQDKAVNVAKFLQNLDSTAKAIKEAELKMAKRRKAIENRTQWLRDYLKNSMESAGISKIESPWFRLAVQKNPEAVEIFDEASIPEDFKEQVVTTRIDKAAMKEAMKAGAEIPGAVLVRNTRLTIR